MFPKKRKAPHISPQEADELIKKILHIQFEKKWMQKDIAAGLGFSQSYTNRLLTKDYPISPRTKRKMIWFIEKYENEK
jgi:hypothetical protein